MDGETACRIGADLPPKLGIFTACGIGKCASRKRHVDTRLFRAGQKKDQTKPKWNHHCWAFLHSIQFSTEPCSTSSSECSLPLILSFSATWVNKHFLLLVHRIECPCALVSLRDTMDGYHDLPEVPRSEPYFPPSSQDIPSSPPSIASDVGFRRKPRKPPPVTPRSFKRFFTPRSMLGSGNNNNASAVRTNRQALKTLSSPAVNRLGPAFTKTLKAIEHRSESPELIRTPSKRRKLSFSSIGSPLQSSPLKEVHVRESVKYDQELAAPVRKFELNVSSIPEHEPKLTTFASKPPRQVPPVRRSQALQTSGALYMRSILGNRANRVTMRANSGAGRVPPLSYTGRLF